MKEIEPIHLNLKDYTSEIKGQRVMCLPTMCPIHWYALYNVKCSKHKDCVVVERCSGCIEELTLHL